MRTATVHTDRQEEANRADGGDVQVAGPSVPTEQIATSAEPAVPATASAVVATDLPSTPPPVPKPKIKKGISKIVKGWKDKVAAASPLRKRKNKKDDGETTPKKKKHSKAVS